MTGRPKTPRSRRSIPIPAEVVALLRVHRKAQLEMRMKSGAGWEDHDLVFSDKNGSPLDRQNLLRRHLRPVLKKAGLDQELTLYSLRHSCASLLLAAGVHPKVVSERLGHPSITTTLDVYSHVTPNIQEEATAQLGEGARQFCDGTKWVGCLRCYSDSMLDCQIWRYHRHDQYP